MSVNGVIIDGGVYPLAGQPPPATSNGWGNMSWLASPFRQRFSGGVAVVSDPRGPRIPRRSAGERPPRSS